MDFGGGDEIRFERMGFAGVVTLNRPQALNALTYGMINALSKALVAWEADTSIKAVVVKAEGRAFCAGGDLMQVYESRGSGNPPIDFFADEYRLNAAIARFPKPYVSLIDGIVMGGGVGISFHGSHRVMTENALFAMPEVGVGFFPDVGGSHILPDLADNFGMYLGLTGARVKWGDALWSGLATHPVKQENLLPLLEMIAMSGEPEAALRNFFSMPRRETEQANWKKIDGWFGEKSVHSIVKALEADAKDELAASILATLQSKSPTSLRVAFRTISSGLTMSVDNCMRMEFRVVNRMLAGRDFYEGIRAVIIDKDNAPKWHPPHLSEVPEKDVDAYFEPLPGGDLLL